MWHIPLNTGERSLLYAAETFEQFETLLRFFERLDNEENDAWWDKLASELGVLVKTEDYSFSSGEYDDDSIFEEGYEEDSPMTAEEQQSVPREEIVTMETTTVNSLGADASFEIEQDMRILLKTQKTGKVSVQDYVEAIAARYPLLGMAVIPEGSRKAVEDTALEAIRISLDHRKVYNWAYLAVFLTIVQYAKNWERAGSSGFWAYICEQFGHKYSQQVYDVLTTSVKEACRSYNRLFVVDPNGDNSYYSTVLAHSLAPSKSFYALCDFLVKFYKNNLDYSVYEEDPAIGRMVGVLRDRCQGATIEQDEDIRGNVSGIQAGLRALITTRPGYVKHFLTKTLQKIGSLLSGDELPGKDYVDVLLTQWFIGKLTEPTIKRSGPIHKRTTEIAFSYGKIRVEYILDEDGEPALRIPSIRLANRENPVLIIRSRGQLVYQYTIGIYGNDYTATSEEVCIPLSDISDADFTELDAEVTIGGKQTYNSDISLNAKALLFKDKKLQTGKTVDEGNYILFSPKSVNIKFQGNVERQRRSYFAQLFDIYIQGEVSVFADGRLLFCSRPPKESLHFRLLQTQVEYLLRDTSYPLFSRDEFSITAIGAFDGKNIEATTQTGEKLYIQNREENICQFSLPNENGGYSVTLTDENTGRVYDEVRFYIVDSYLVAFDSDYYLESADDGNVMLDIDGQHFELSLMGFASKVKIPCGNGDIQIQIPRVRLLLDGNPLPTEAVWKGDISPSSTLRVLCPETLVVSLSFAGTTMTRRSIIGGFDYAIGNAVQAYDGTAEKVSVNLLITGDNIHMFDVVFKMSLTEPLSFNLTENTLMWLNSHSFMGEKSTILKFVFLSKYGEPIVLVTGQGKKVLSEDFPSKSERYHYQVIAQTETAFGVVESTLADGAVIFGDKVAVIFRGEILRITKVIEEGNFTEIKPVFVEGITYIGTENLGYTDLSGDYAHYTAKLFFMTRNGKRYFTDLNPVDIYLVNDKSGILHISFRDGDGLFIDKSGDYGTELYKHIDPPPRLEKYFNIPDFFVYQYSKEMY
jgi:hypothetical protein